MNSSERIDIDPKEQYQTTDFLKIRIRTHLKYSVEQTDLDSLVRKVMPLTGEENLLEIGCGTGGYLRKIREGNHAGFLAGLDLSPAMLAEAVERARNVGATVSWLQGDANALPFFDGVFNGVIARHMLYHVPDIPGALNEMKRVLKPDGWAFIVTNSRHSLPRIAELLRDVRAEFGFEVSDHRVVSSFCIENATEIIRPAFGEIEETILTDALRFDSPNPIFDYAATLLPSVTAEDANLRGSMLLWLKREIPLRLSRYGGEWLDPKNVGLYRCANLS
jgi:ubiquinone/menaquinone biosynthesis C-methylase UbiE